MIAEAITWAGCVLIISAAALIAFRWWLDSTPPCTRKEFERLVQQVNVLTESMTVVQQTSDSLRSAVGMTQIRR